MSLRFDLQRKTGRLTRPTDPQLEWALAWCFRIGLPFVIAGALFAGGPFALLWWLS